MNWIHLLYKIWPSTIWYQWRTAVFYPVNKIANSEESIWMYDPQVLHMTDPCWRVWMIPVSLSPEHCLIPPSQCQEKLKFVSKGTWCCLWGVPPHSNGSAEELSFWGDLVLCKTVKTIKKDFLPGLHIATRHNPKCPCGVSRGRIPQEHSFLELRRAAAPLLHQGIVFW